MGGQYGLNGMLANAQTHMQINAIAFGIPFSTGHFPIGIYPMYAYIHAHTHARRPDVDADLGSSELKLK